MILIDANIAIYAYNASDPRQERAREWLEATIAGEEPAGFALATLLAFVRIMTDPRIHQRPLAPAAATEVVSAWFTHDNVVLVNPTPSHWSTISEIAERGQARGPMLMDAHLAALALEHGARLATTDRDFSRFSSLRTFDPLATA